MKPMEAKLALNMLHGKKLLMFFSMLFLLSTMQALASESKSDVISKKKPVSTPKSALKQGKGVDIIKFADCRMEKGTSKEFAFEQKDADVRQIRFVCEVRFIWGTLGGYAPGMSLTINGERLTGSRLLNKPLKFKTRVGEGIWGRPNKNGYYLMYSKDFSNEIKTNENFIYGLWEKEQEPYRFVFDLTGMTSHNLTNKVKLNATRLPIALRNIRIEFDPTFMPRINDTKATVKPAPTGKLDDCSLKEIANPKILVKSAKSGAFVLEANKLQVPIESKFSLPNGKWLTVDVSGKLKNVTLPYVKTFTTPEYILERRIEPGASCIKIFDTFTNRRDKITGVMFSNSLKLPQNPDCVLFGGAEVMLKERNFSPNPSFGTQVQGNFIAFLAEDDILRTQGYQRKEEDTLIIGDRNLGLPPKASHTLEWSLYFIPNGGYYDFVNAVRRAWKSNFQLDGPYTFPYGGGSGGIAFDYWTKEKITQEQVADFLKKRNVKHVITHVPGNYSCKPSRKTPRLGHGTALGDENFKCWRDQTRNMTIALKKYAPDVKVHSYLHKNLCTELNNRNKYQDSFAMDQTSKHFTKTGTSAYYQPTTNNSYGKSLKNVYEYMVENLGTHIYMDEICLRVTAWEKYPEWDQCTVYIDRATHGVKDTVSIPNLLVRPWLNEMDAYLKAKNRKLIANAAPLTRTVQNFRAMHFVEHGAGKIGLLSAHFSTPLGTAYSSGPKGLAHLREILDYGFVSLAYSGEWSSHCFPITPLEIRPGYIIGKERIVTNRSGVFGWNDNSNADVFVYNANGKRIEKGMVKSGTKDGKTVFEIRMPSDHIAILVRKWFGVGQLLGMAGVLGVSRKFRTFIF